MKQNFWKFFGGKSFRIVSAVGLIGASSAIANAQMVDCAACLMRMQIEATNPLTSVASPLTTQSLNVAAALTGSKTAPITFTHLEYQPKSNWDPFSGNPLPGGVGTLSGFDPNFSTPYWNDQTGFTNAPTAPWNMYLPSQDAQAVYTVGKYNIGSASDDNPASAIYWGPLFN
jgi:hypothetical protein